MIRRNLRRLTARIHAMRSAAAPYQRMFIRSADEFSGWDGLDEEGGRRHEAEPGTNTSAERLQADRVAPEGVDALVRLAFRSLLRRDADAETYAAYRDGFERGTTFLDLVNDVVQSEEFKIVDERIERLLASSGASPAASPMPEHPIAGDMGAALTLLEARLGDKGCNLQLGAVPVGAVDGPASRARMQSLMVTLASMEML